MNILTDNQAKLVYIHTGKEGLIMPDPDEVEEKAEQEEEKSEQLREAAEEARSAEEKEEEAEDEGGGGLV